MATAFRSISLGLALATVACDAPRTVPSPSHPSPGNVTSAAPSASPKRAPVVVAMVVDQFSAWMAMQRVPLLSEDGGFARLRREGTWMQTMRYAHAVTDTAPGHAALHTGKAPYESGVWGNEMADPATGKRSTILRDMKLSVVTPTGPEKPGGSSPELLIVDTVADRLRAANPDALIVSISLKDRGAIMPVGKSPTVALWFDPAVGSWVSSTAYTKALPSWVGPIAGPNAVVKMMATPWEPLDRAWLGEHTRRDDASGEGDLDGFGITFPHVAKTNAAFRSMPWTDTTILSLAQAALDTSYDPAKPTLLLLSMSTSDVIGHIFGPDSWESWDQIRRLDRELGKFMGVLDAKVGAFTMLLAADHGNLSMPEAQAEQAAQCPKGAPPSVDAFERPQCVVGKRFEPNVVREELLAETKKRLGAGSWIIGLADPYVLLTDAGKALDPTKRATLDAAVKAVIERHRDTVGEMFDVRDLAKKCPGVLASAAGIPERARAGEPILTLVCRSWMPGRGGDYYLVPKQGSFWDGEIVPLKGSSHGGPFLYDRTVPLFVRAPGEVDAGKIVTDPIDFTAYASLEASLLGLDPRRPREILGALTTKP